MSKDLNEHLASIGAKGGNATLKKYGTEHFISLSALAKHKLTPKRRREIARKAAQDRWAKRNEDKRD